MEVTDRALWQTCRMGNLSVVKRWPQCVLTRRVKGQTLAYIASKYGNLELLHWLSGEGVCLSAANARNITPFSAAIKHGHLKVAQFLHSKGADINLPDVTMNTPFLYACIRGHEGCARWLHQIGADITRANKSDEDALILACMYYHLPLADWLRSVRAYPVASYKTVMRTASVRGDLPVAKWVCSVGRQYLDDAHGPPMYHACANSSLNVAEWLLRQGVGVNTPYRGETPFYAAATMYHMEAMAWLHSNGASITAPDAEGFTPLRRICTGRFYNDRFYFHYYAVWLILNGAVSNRMGHISRSALRKQVGRGRKPVRDNIERLLEESARYVRVLVRLRLGDDVVGYIADYVGVLRGRKLRNARQTLLYI
jgi:hypothetical protein